MDKQFEFGLQVNDPKEFEGPDLENLLSAVDSAIQNMGGPQGFVILSPNGVPETPYVGLQQSLTLLQEFKKIFIYNDPSFSFVKH